MFRFFKNINNVTRNIIQNRTLSTHTRNTPGQDALDTIKILYNQGEYRKALQLLNEIEKNYPSCSKAAKFYRGMVAVKVLDEVEVNNFYNKKNS